MKLLIRQGRVIDPSQGTDAVRDILIENNRIVVIAENIKTEAEKTINAKGLVVLPGLVDMHVHMREPGREDKETIQTATTAALAGGVTSVLAMPNTSPCIDSAQSVGLLQKRIQKSARVNVFVAGAITKNRKGHALVDFKGLHDKGVVAFTDDGASVDDDRLLAKALAMVKEINSLIICHCEDTALSNDGAVNYGITSTRMGLRGISRESEYKRIERDINLAASCGARIHIAHISCAESVEIIKKAKQAGIRVTADTCPHYLVLCEEDVIDFDTNKKMNPPLRGQKDREALIRAVQDGTIDVVASDHAPHTENEKDIEFERAAFGVIGLETLFPACISALCDHGPADYTRIIQACANSPAKILGIDRGFLKKGSYADIAILDPVQEWAVEKQHIVSKSKNSPFIGRRLKGKVVHTILNGEPVYNAGGML